MWSWYRAAIILGFVSGAVCAQPTAIPNFETASVRVSQSRIGHEGVFTAGPDRLTARNTTLKRLIYEAWQVGYARISGEDLAGWVSDEEYDIDAKAPYPVSSSELHQMLRTLLEDRFKLAERTEARVSHVYALGVGKGGAKLHGPAREDQPGIWRFHGTLDQFADVLALKLTEPLVTDPSTPSVAQGRPIPVVNKTGIEGSFDFAIPMSINARESLLAFWQRTLQEQLGLTLEPAEEPVEFLVIAHAERPRVDK
jgi:uncharacterized protein (TIGR03435 family)